MVSGASFLAANRLEILIHVSFSRCSQVSVFYKGRMGLSIYIVSSVYQEALISSQTQVIAFSLWHMVNSTKRLIEFLLLIIDFLTIDSRFLRRHHGYHIYGVFYVFSI